MQGVHALHAMQGQVNGCSRKKGVAHETCKARTTSLVDSWRTAGAVAAGLEEKSCTSLKLPPPSAPWHSSSLARVCYLPSLFFLYVHQLLTPTSLCELRGGKGEGPRRRGAAGGRGSKRETRHSDEESN